MKHLKYFESKSEELPKDIKQDLFDICQEIKDKGCFQIHYSHFNAPEHYRYPSDDSIMIDTTDPRDGASVVRYFKYDEISEVVERIRDFMNMKGYNISIRLNGYDSEFISNELRKSCCDRLFECRIFFIKRKINEAKKIQDIIKLKELDIYQDLKDICLELQDEGFHINIKCDYTRDNNMVNHKIPPMKFRFNVSIDKKINFDYKEISEVVERLKDYMSQNDFISMVKVPIKGIRRDVDYNIMPTMFVDIETTDIRFGKGYLDSIPATIIEFTEK